MREAIAKSARHDVQIDVVAATICVIVTIDKVEPSVGLYGSIFQRQSKTLFDGGEAPGQG